MSSFQSDLLTEFCDMLRYGRPHDSWAERQFIDRFLTPLGVKPDGFGNGIVRIGSAPVLWSVHTDTVHWKPAYQAVKFDNGILSLRSPEKGLCLGADDTAGVFLAREMIRAQVPGLYIFHRAEEHGGKGSLWIATHAPDTLKRIKWAIALDRKGYGDVITHQGARCCSDKFAKSLAKKLGGSFRPDDTGMFTDTANYTDLVGECTNISVGYEDNHSAEETVDFEFLMELRDTLCRFDVSGLPASRKPGEVDWEYESYSRQDWTHGYERDFDETADLDNLVSRYPEVAADILRDMGYDAESFAKIVKDMRY